MFPDLPPAPPLDVDVADVALVATTELKRNNLMPGHRTSPTVECFVREADRHKIDPLVLLAVLRTEGGRPGEVALNRNGTVDLGMMSVNTVWLPTLAKHYRMPEQEVKQRLALDGCANVAAAAWILGRKISETGDVWEGVARYHSTTPAKQGIYLKRVYENFSRIVARATELLLR